MSSPSSPPASVRGSTVADDLRRLEPLLEKGDWQMVRELLSPQAKANRLPPALGLLFVTAQEELAESPREATDPLAVRCVSELFGLPAECETTAVLAARITRRYPERRRSSFGEVMSKVSGWFRRGG